MQLGRNTTGFGKPAPNCGSRVLFARQPLERENGNLFRGVSEDSSGLLLSIFLFNAFIVQKQHGDDTSTLLGARATLPHC